MNLCQNTTDFVSNQTLFCIEEMWHDCERHPCTTVNITRRSSKNNNSISYKRTALQKHLLSIGWTDSPAPKHTPLAEPVLWQSVTQTEVPFGASDAEMTTLRNKITVHREDFVKWFIVCFFHQMCLMVGWKHYETDDSRRSDLGGAWCLIDVGSRKKFNKTAVFCCLYFSWFP